MRGPLGFLFGRSGYVPLHLAPRPRRRGRLISTVAASTTLIALVAIPGGLASAQPAATKVSTFQQCANGAPGTTPSTSCNDGWINGELGSNNSQYAEGQVVPQRLDATVSGSTSHTITIEYLDRKGSATAHAYDSLATWNFTESTADPCQGITASLCSGTPSTFPIPPDPTPVPPCSAPCTSDVTSAHQLPNQNFVLFGGTITGTSAYTHSAPSSPTTDDETTITINYTASSGTEIVFLYGGHLAASTEQLGWGSGLGSANINGGPYHQSLVAADGSSIGGRDNNIKSSAILGPAAFTIAKSATPNPANTGQTVTYTITVTNTGNSAGSTSFTDTNDSRVTNISAVTSNPPGANCTESGQTIMCSTTTLNPGASQTFMYTAVMPTSFSGSPGPGCGMNQFPVPNTATLNNNAGQVTFVECVNAPPMFGYTKTATPNPANPSQTVTYTITVTNNGQGPGVATFTDANDPRVTMISAVTTNPAGGSCTLSGTTLSCTTGSVPLDPGSSMTFTYTANMPASFSGPPPPGCGTNQFPVTNTVTQNGTEVAHATVCVNTMPNLVFSKTANPMETTPGGTVNYVISVTNNGTEQGMTTFTDTTTPTPQSISAVTVSGGTGSCTASGTTLNCSTGPLDPGQTETFSYSAVMPATFDGTPGTDNCGSNQFPVVNNVVPVSGEGTSAKVCVTANPHFLFTKNANPMTVNAGGTVTYTITVTNDGQAPGMTSFTDTSSPPPASITAVTVSGGKGSCTESGTTIMCSTGNLKAGQTETFTYMATMPSSFTGPPGPGCGPNQFPVTNTVNQTSSTVTTQVAQTTVCVNANPKLVFSKTAVPTQTTPGGTVNYTITVTNNGSAPGATTFTDTSVPTPQSITAVTVSGGTGSCTESGTTINCMTGTVNPGQTETFTYSAVMPATFSGSPGGGTCGPNQFPVVNTVTPSGASGSTEVGTSAQVCVTATPTLTLSKSARLTDGSGNSINPPATTGDDIVYTLTYGNTGTADANNTVITDSIPAGTEFIGCTGGCVPSGSPVTSVTWNIGTVKAGVTGQTVTLTVAIVTVTSCTITNTATISSPNFTPPGGQPGGQLPASVSVTSTPGPNPAGANASGTAAGAVVNVLGLVTATIPAPPTHTAQGGIGESAAGSSVANPSITGVLNANLISTSNDAKVVGGAGAAATDRATAETAGACVLPVSGLCTVGASVILANAETTASDTSASISSAGSTFVGLTVEGLPLANVAPNTCINLPAAVFGAGSFIGLFVQSPSSGSSGFPTTCPPSGQTGSAGLTTINGVPAFAADLTVTMIYVHVTNLAGLGKVDVAVSQATAHSDFPPLAANCGSSNIQSVSGDAFIASEDTTPSIVPALVGYVSIPPSGGADSQSLATVFLPASSSYPNAAISAGVSSSNTLGLLSSTASSSDSDAQVAGLCLFPVAGATGPPSAKNCAIYASLAKSVAYGQANSVGAATVDSDAKGPNFFGATEFQNLSIGGQTIALPVSRNMSLLPAGLPIEIILDEQTCDNGTSTSTGVCLGANHAGLTVTAIHVILLGPMNGLPIGAEIKVAQAHSDVTFG